MTTGTVTKLLIYLTVTIFIIISGIACSGSGKLVLKEIQGPGTLDENAVADYYVGVEKGIAGSYAWTIDPSDAGVLTNTSLATCTFQPDEVTVDSVVTITVTVTGANTPAIIESREITVTDTNQMPHAAAQVDKPRIGHGQTVQFFNESTDPEGDTDIVKCEWDFSFDEDDGFCCECEDVNPRHQFDDPGIFQVQLRITDHSNLTDTLTQPISIEVVENYAPVISQITHSRTTSQAGNDSEAVQLTCEFADSAPLDDTHTYLWTCEYGTFDDHTTRTPVWFPPEAPVDCDINVVVTDWFGLTDTGSCHQWVTEFPVIVNNSAPGNLIPSRYLVTALDGTINPADWVFPNKPDDGSVIFMNYWASWASASLDGIPLLLDVYDTYKSDDDYYQLMINESEELQDVVDFINLNLYQCQYWPLDNDASYFLLTKGWAENSNTVPQSVLFDRDGHCRWSYVGQLTWAIELQLAIEELL